MSKCPMPFLFDSQIRQYFGKDFVTLFGGRDHFHHHTAKLLVHRGVEAVDKELGGVVMKMIAPSEKRYEVFTEVLAELGIK